MVVLKFSTSNLKQIAEKCLCIPLTSASSKWCFSGAGLTVSKLRTHLSGNTLEALMVMRCNKVLLQLNNSMNKFFQDIGGG